MPNGGFEIIDKKPSNQSGSFPKWQNSSFPNYRNINSWSLAAKCQGFGFHHPLVSKRQMKLAGRTCHYCDRFPANSGTGYIAICTYRPEPPGANGTWHSRQYIQVKLESPLKKNESYHFSMWVRTSNYAATFFTSGLGAYLSNSNFYITPKELKDHYYVELSPQIICDSVISNVDEWKEIDSYYLAKGGEQYLTIGNFFFK